MKSKLRKRQTKTITKTVTAKTPYDYNKIRAVVRYDDQCGNGHNTFSITGETTVRGRDDMGGCIHDEIAKHFPELAHLIKWHGTTSEGPLYYVSNTLYHARDTDHDGLKEGEYSAHTVRVISDDVKEDETVTLYSTGQIYINKTDNPYLKIANEQELEKLEAFKDGLKVGYSVEKVNSPYSLSKGKPADLEAARRCAIWPDATLEQLQDKEALVDRLPALMEEFRADVEAFGFKF